MSKHCARAYLENAQTWGTFGNVTFIASFFLQLPKRSCFWALVVIDETWKTGKGTQCSLSDNKVATELHEKGSYN